MSSPSFATNSQRTKRVNVRMVFWWFLAILFALLAALLIRRLILGDIVSPDSTYNYEIKQQLSEQVNYFDTSYFNPADLSNKPAYITNLTDTISLNHKYFYQADRAVDLKYTYSAHITLQAGYRLEGDKSPSRVWSHDYEAIPITEKKVTGQAVQISETITVPFAEYKRQMDNFKADFSLPTNGEIIVVVDVKISGIVDSVPVGDVRQVRIKIPLDQQIYGITTDLQSQESKTINVGDQLAFQQTKQYQLLAAVVCAILSLVFLVISFSDWLSDHLAKTPYQRQLASIYKCHDSIIVQTSKPMSLSGKSVVEVETFDDILDIEDSSKSPIIAKEIGDKATRFMIIQEDIVYTYVLGDLPVARRSTERDDNKTEPNANGRLARRKIN